MLGRVSALWVFPVKSMSGTRVESAEVTEAGLSGDRSWAVVDEHGTALTAREEPRLRAAVARLVEGELRVDVPGSSPELGAADAAEALSSWLGRPVRLEHRDGSGFVDVAPVHLVSHTSLADAAHAEECDACDVTSPRANLVLDLTAGVSERDWVGSRLVAGHSTLTVSRLPKHCLGAYADVTQAGVVRVGDEVRGD